MNNSGLSGGWSGEIVLIRFLFSLSFFFFLILFLTSKILRRKTDDLSRLRFGRSSILWQTHVGLFFIIF